MIGYWLILETDTIRFPDTSKLPSKDCTYFPALSWQWRGVIYLSCWWKMLKKCHMSIHQLAYMNLEQYQYYCPWRKGTKCGYDGMDMGVPWIKITAGSRATWFLQWYKYYQLFTIKLNLNSTLLISVIYTINFMACLRADLLVFLVHVPASIHCLFCLCVCFCVCLFVCLVVWLFGWRFSSHLRIFHSYWNVTFTGEAVVHVHWLL